MSLNSISYSQSSSESEALDLLSTESSSEEQEILDKTNQIGQSSLSALTSSTESTSTSSDDEIIDLREESPEKQENVFNVRQTSDTVLNAADIILDGVSAAAKLAGEEYIGAVADNIQVGTNIAMGVKAADEGKCSLDMKVLNQEGSYQEKFSLRKASLF